jgi:enoyl-CoA hydratase/carnithine racemase
MTFKDVLYEVRDGVARITINRPKQYTAFTGDTLKEMTLAVETAGADASVGAIVLTGAGDKAFCAGGDVNWEKEGGSSVRSSSRTCSTRPCRTVRSRSSHASMAMRSGRAITSPTSVISRSRRSTRSSGRTALGSAARPLARL